MFAKFWGTKVVSRYGNMVFPQLENVSNTNVFFIHFFFAFSKDRRKNLVLEKVLEKRGVVFKQGLICPLKKYQEPVGCKHERKIP